MRLSTNHASLLMALAIVVGVLGCAPEAPAPAPAEGAASTSREAATVAKGAEAVVKRKCVTCHGENMAGAAKELVVPGASDLVELFPPNLTPDFETGLGDPDEKDLAKRGYSDELLARAIRQGFDRNDQELCPQMKHFAEMSDFEVYSIIKYLRSLPPVKKKILRSVCAPLKTKVEQER
jgi:hypothetical protein